MNEKVLIEKSLKGDEEAFKMLLEQNKPFVYNHCLSIVKDESIAEDLTQETFVHAFQHLDSFRMESKLSTWLWRIAHNLSINFLRRHRQFEQEFKEDLLPTVALQKTYIDEELLAKINVAMEKLSPKHKVVFEMYDIRRIPQKQIAAELGISYGTVRSRLFYARQQIRKFLQEA
jgi:RNA polymerase sigma-70 factor, ECF subfamily